MVRKISTLSIYSLLVTGMFFPGNMVIESAIAAEEGDCRPGIIWMPNSNSVATCTGDATVTDVLEGTTFSNDGGIGLSGAMINRRDMSFTPSDVGQNIPQGYHDGSGTVAGDTDLTSSNIKNGISIFGVPGSVNVVDTSSGDAVATDLLLDKIAWVDGTAVTGTLESQSLSADSTTVAAGVYAGTTLDAVDADLATPNIRAGQTIFGVPGDSNVVNTISGDAVEGDIMAGKRAWVDGSEVIGNNQSEQVCEVTNDLLITCYSECDIANDEASCRLGCVLYVSLINEACRP